MYMRLSKNEITCVTRHLEAELRDSKCQMEVVLNERDMTVTKATLSNPNNCHVAVVLLQCQVERVINDPCTLSHYAMILHVPVKLLMLLILELDKLIEERKMQRRVHDRIHQDTRSMRHKRKPTYQKETTMSRGKHTPCRLVSPPVNTCMQDAFEQCKSFQSKKEHNEFFKALRKKRKQKNKKK